MWVWFFFWFFFFVLVFVCLVFFFFGFSFLFWFVFVWWVFFWFFFFFFLVFVCLFAYFFSWLRPNPVIFTANMVNIQIWKMGMYLKKNPQKMSALFYNNEHWNWVWDLWLESNCLTLTKSNPGSHFHRLSAIIATILSGEHHPMA